MLQAIGHNVIYACRRPAEQEATSRLCGSLAALHCCGWRSFFLSSPAICRKAGDLCCCVISACCHLSGTTALFLPLQCDFRRQPSVVESSSTFSDAILFHLCKYCPTAMYCCVPCATRTRAVCAVCHAWSASKLFFSWQSSALWGRCHLRRERHNKDMH